MTEIDKPRIELDPNTTVLYLRHRPEDGSVHISDAPSIGNYLPIVYYLRELYKENGVQFIEELNTSGSITTFIGPGEIPQHTLLFPQVTNEELLQWKQAREIPIVSKPWRFKMGQGAIIDSVTGFEEFPQFNLIAKFLQQNCDTLQAWASGIKREFDKRSLGNTSQ
ncbi:hypothetical protein HGA88_04005 [Candidatus Roizmanbacteria bacterium]|nr:hypothetical protein [Candidatus Roizmanbacteria bacterium]